jgi:hypothetical protein
MTELSELVPGSRWTAYGAVHNVLEPPVLRGGQYFVKTAYVEDDKKGWEFFDFFVCGIGEGFGDDGDWVRYVEPKVCPDFERYLVWDSNLHKSDGFSLGETEGRDALRAEFVFLAGVRNGTPFIEKVK